MYITCIYLHISGGLNPGESFWRPPALDDMWPHSTSRLHFCNIDRGPENVPPPTMFLQVSAANLITDSSTFEELFGLFLISSLTDSPPVKAGTAPSCSHVFPVLGGREPAEPPQACDPPFWVERSWVPSTG